jgi:hypothetical protein
LRLHPDFSEGVLMRYLVLAAAIAVLVVVASVSTQDKTIAMAPGLAEGLGAR